MEGKAMLNQIDTRLSRSLSGALIGLVLGCGVAQAQAQTTDQGPSPAPDVEATIPAVPVPETPAPETPAVAPTQPAEPDASSAADPGPADPATTDQIAPVEDTTTVTPTSALAPTDPDLLGQARAASSRAMTFLEDGGVSIWVIAALSVITVALILWKIWRLALIGAWSRGKAIQSVAIYETGDAARARAIVEGRRGIRSKVLSAALQARTHLPQDAAREETARVAKRELASARSGLSALELIATIAPLLGLLGTVLGMIAAFQALQAAGSKADPALLAGGIWEALLTTAAGMAVAIPASAALTWFESVIDRIRRDIEDNATRVFIAPTEPALRPAAE
ncbi:MAG: MotA/TolQ/ExbB proton channel family protein [Marinibacterium sp.]|nr:MotA/TolQ/ExbB proton channel family protein [Marinibacterium sp.]